jgi:hypothetical protein
MSLFKVGNYILRSGQQSQWIIDCDCLSLLDWDALASIPGCMRRSLPTGPTRSRRADRCVSV